MYDYAAYGLTICSEFHVPELVEASTNPSASAPRPKGEADVTVSLETIPRRQANNSGNEHCVWATSDEAFIDYPGTAAFLVRKGRQIIIDAQCGAEDRLVRLFLLGPVLALLLHQRKFLVLHASAVALGDEAVAFVGDKGMGKSTMAAAMLARHHPLIADDLVAVDTTAVLPLAYPGFPQLKLFPESAALLDPDPRHLPKVHPEFDKRARRTEERFETRALPLRRIFVLENGTEDCVQRLTQRQGFMELVRHSYLLGFLQATRSAVEHFQQATALASRVEVSRLIRRRSLEALPTIAKLVEDDVERAA
jgi:hypothetical protein